ncbi:MAG: efflux RND transporter periplasmic adaptor subunit [Acidobacteriaceae bacterium]
MSQHNASHAATHDAAASLRPTRGATRRGILLMVVLLAVAVIVAVVGILSRVHAHSTLRKHTDSMAVPAVAVDLVQAGKPTDEVVLPGAIQAFNDAPIYARTNGYVKSWSHDIGSHVHKGELLAVIETPELDKQVDQARAQLITAEATAHLSQATAKRYTGLTDTDAVSKESIDTAVDTERAQKAAVASTQQNLNHLLELQSFERVYAPFDGTVTARNTDIGQLVDAGSSGGTGSATSLSGNAMQGRGSGPRELFHVSYLGVVRIYVNVPEADAQEARPGTMTDINVSQFPGKVFHGKIVRTANAEDLTTRTLMVEVDMENRHGELLPGAYAQVHIKLPLDHPALIIPVSSMLFRAEGLRVVTVDRQDRVHLQSITVGRDWGTRIEVLTGLQANERILDSPPDSIAENEKVRVVSGPQAADNGGGLR